jgi:serine protease Do
MVLEKQPVQAWAVTGTAGEAVTVTMSSTDFDSYLFAYGPGMERVETDDDGAGDLNAQLTLRFRESGTFIIGASALSAGSAGSYTLEMVRTPGPLDLTVEGTLDIPGSTSGLLSDDDAMLDDRRSQAWTFEGTAGRTVTIDLSSGDFDSYLTVIGPGITAPVEDDDSGGDLHSRIVLTLQESGTFRIVVSALGPGAGAFELSVR